MSRDYFAVFSQLFREPKYRTLSDSQRVTLFTLWGIAGDQTPEATWADSEWLARLMTLHQRPTEDVAALIEVGWLDRLDDDSIAIHDWDDWQLAGSKKIRDAYEAARKRGWRRDNPRSRPPDQSERKSESEERDESESERGPDSVRTPKHPFSRAWQARGLTRPSRKQEELLDTLLELYGHAAMVRWLEAMPPDASSTSKAIEYLLGKQAA